MLTTGKKRYRLLLLTALLWVAGALSSCLKEDLSDCPTDEFMLRVGFENVTAAHGPQVGRVDVFIFDSDDILRQTLSESGMSFTAGYRMETWLPAGRYRFVSWSNIGTDYKTVPGTFVPGVTTLDEVSLSFDFSGGTVVDYDPALLLHGATTAEVDLSLSDGEVAIPVRQDNYRINLTVEGVADDHNYSVTISDDNGAYYFDNDFAPSGALQYTRGPLAAPAGKFTTSLTTLRLERGRSPILSIIDEDTQTPLFSVDPDLVELILKRETNGGPVVDFSTEYEFDIHMEYDKATMTATIRINGWTVITGDDEILG
jgi:Protein of unknown function (DUF1812).